MARVVRAVVIAAMVLLSGCGRQVTGLNEPNGGIVPPGQMLIRFETAVQPDYNTFSYLIVFNTTGNALQPLANGQNSNYQNWSTEFVVGGTGNVAVTPLLNQIYQDPTTGTTRSFQRAPLPQGTISFVPVLQQVSPRIGFQIAFDRCLLDLPVPTAASQPPLCQNPSGAYQYIQPLWAISLFTLDKSGNVIDSLSPTAPQNADYQFAVNTANLINDQQYTKASSNTQVSNPAAQITGVEVFNTP